LLTDVLNEDAGAVVLDDKLALPIGFGRRDNAADFSGDFGLGDSRGKRPDLGRRRERFSLGRLS
jgi:hypothetical protein